MDRKDLAQLVNSAKKGNNESFAKLYAYFANNVYYFALRITKNKHDADDIVQDTMVSLYNNLKTLKDPSTVSSFVNKIAYNYCLMLFRKRKDVLTDNDTVFEESFDENEEFIPEVYLEVKELREEIVSILDNLPDAQRATIMMYYFEDLTTKEIAEIFEVSEEAVRGRLFRGRESIKKVISVKDLKGALMVFMAVSVLSQILDVEAKAAFDSVAQVNNWKAVAAQVGIPAAEIAATLGIAGLNGVNVANSVAITATGAVGVKGIIATVVAISIVTMGTTIAYRAYVDNNDSNIINSMSEVHGVTSIKNIDVNTGQAVYQEDVNMAMFAQNSVNHEIDKDSNAQQMRDVSLKRGNNLPLKYSLGSKVTIQNIIDDAQVSILEGSEIIATHFEELDTSKAGEYIVYLQTNNESEFSKVMVIIILVD